MLARLRVLARPGMLAPPRLLARTA